MKYLTRLRVRVPAVVSIVTVTALLGGFLWQALASAAPPAFVQAASATASGGSSSIAKAFTSANAAGNLVVAAVTWSATASGSSLTCTDTKANTYTTALTQFDTSNGKWLGICYAPNVKAGTNTVTASFGASRQTRRMVIAEYAGVATAAAVDVTARNSAAGTTGANAITSTAATTTVAGDLIFGAVMDTTSTTTITAGTGFTQRGFTNNKDLAVQDMIQAAAGSVASTQTFGAAHRYDAAMVAFKSATVTPDTTPPTTPTGLTAQAVSASQINLSWTASFDNVGVTGYKIYRNGTFLKNVTASPTQDTGLTASTTYSYTVSAVDAAGNESTQTAAAQATTQTPDTTPPSASMTAPARGSTVASTVTVSANASDNVGVQDVEFLLDGVTINDDTTAPYSFQWDTTTTSNGPHLLAARAHDTSGNLGITSDTFTVQVNNQPSQLPVDMMAGWPFSESTGTSTVDVTAYGNNASFSSLSEPVWAAGKTSGGVKFDASNTSFLTVNDSPTIDITGNALTLSMWINPTGSQSTDGVLFGKFWNGAPGTPFYQYGLEYGHNNVPVFYIGQSNNTSLSAVMGTTIPTGQWSHLAVVFNGTTCSFYLNGSLVNTAPMSGSIVDRTGSTVRIGNDLNGSQGFKGTLDDVRLYKRAQTQAEVQADMNKQLVGNGGGVGPSVNITAPTQNQQVSNIFTLTADASDAAGVQFFVDGTATGPEDTIEPYAANWDTRAASNGAHTITARARDINGNTTVSNPIVANVVNSDSFQNEVLATGFNLPTAMKFLPDGRMLVAELTGKIWIVPAPYTTPNPLPFMTIPDIGTSATSQEGIFDFAFDPNFANNHYLYISYTVNNGHDRLARFTVNSSLDGVVGGSMFVIYEDTQSIPSDEHHGAAIAFDNNGHIFFTTGEHFQGTPAQDLTSPWGKVLRYNMDGSVPTDNPFYDGAGPHFDAVYALGFRNPYRATFDTATNRLLVGDVGGNDYSTAYEEVDNVVAGANYGWPNCEFGTCGNSAYSPAMYAYPHLGRDAAITGGFVYHATGHSGDFPSGFEGNYFYGDYAQNWIKRLTFDAQGNVSGVNNFEPASGVLDGPYGDIVYLTEGPDGSLYYIDLGYSDVSGTFGTSKIHRIRYQTSNQAPSAMAAADVTSGPTPLTVNFNSNGSTDPEGQPLTYSWDFGDGSELATTANPSHTYTVAGVYTVRLTVSDGVNSTFSPPITIQVGSVPTATILAPTDGATFRGGDVISFSGDATDPDDGTLPASAFSWTIDFLHEGHVHPGPTITGAKSGTFTIPVTGHDFSGNTRFRFTLTVTDSTGLKDVKTVTIWPQKVNLTFNTAPQGQTLYLDGIAHATPFVYDTLINFQHQIEARNASSGNTNYTFASWSDGGAQIHTLLVPAADAGYTATYNVTTVSNGPAAAWGFNEASGTTAADATSNSNTVTLVGGVTHTTSTTGHGNALTFSGSGQYLTAPNSSSLDISGTAFTMSMWVNPSTTSTGDQVVIGKHWNTAMTSPYYQYGLELQQNGARPVFQIGTSSGVLAADMGSSLTKGVWSNLAIVWNGTTAQFYVNGTLVHTSNLSATITARGNPLRIGADANTQQFFKGSLDDVRIYNRVLSANDVQADMNTAL